MAVAPEKNPKSTIKKGDNPSPPSLLKLNYFSSSAIVKSLSFSLFEYCFLCIQLKYQSIYF